jgi:bacillithiol system protein YtxJ
MKEMHPALKPLSGMDELDRALAASAERPLLLFKHSFTCGVSTEALDELLTHLTERRQDASYAMVTVQTHREVSNAVARKLGVRHETPQALLIRKGRVVWSASHFRVTAAAVDAAFNAVAFSRQSPAPRPTPTTTPTEN